MAASFPPFEVDFACASDNVLHRQRYSREQVATVMSGPWQPYGNIPPPPPPPPTPQSRSLIPPPPPPPPPPPRRPAFFSSHNHGHMQQRWHVPQPPVCPRYGVNVVAAAVQLPAFSNPAPVPGNPPRYLHRNAPAHHHNAPNEELTKIASRSWRCDACDLTLESEIAKKSHLKSHVKCTECSFEGAPKVVKGHYQSVHGKFSGAGFKTVTVAIPGCRVQRFKICVGNRPEDVERWISERRRRFPRQQEAQESNQTRIGEAGISLTTNKTQEKIETGITSLLAGYGSSSDDNESDCTYKNKISGNGLPIEISEVVSDANTQMTPQQAKNKDGDGHPQRSARPCRFFMLNGICRNGDACRFSHDMTKSFSTGRSERQHVRQSKTLLRRLLANDMRRETTLAVQLLIHVAKRKYFQIDNRSI